MVGSHFFFYIKAIVKKKIYFTVFQGYEKLLTIFKIIYEMIIYGQMKIK